MSARVTNLLDQSDVPLRLVAGRAGLGREVVRAHVSDLAEPWPYMGQRELLLTNGTGMGSTPKTQTRFIARLDRAGASGLVYGLDTGPVLTDAAIQEAERAGLPLFILSRFGRFSDICQLVSAWNLTDDQLESSRIGRIYGVLHEALVRSEDLGAVLGALGDECRVQMSLARRVDGEPLPGFSAIGSSPDDVRAVAAEAPVGQGAVVSSPAGAGDVLTLVHLDADPSLVLLVKGVEAATMSDSLLRHLATAVGIGLGRSRSQTSTFPSESGALLRALAGADSAGVSRDNLRALGFDLATCIVVVARTGMSCPSTSAIYVPSAGWGERHISLRNGGEYVALVDTAGRDVRAMDFYAPRWFAGLSRAVQRSKSVRERFEEARWATAIAEVTDRLAVRAGDPSDWMFPRSRRHAAVEVDQSIGGLLAFDQTSGSSYVHTLGAWLANDRSWARTAGELGIHRQTLGYRLRKIERILGVDLSTSEQIALLWRGIRAHQLMVLCDSVPMLPGR